MAKFDKTLPNATLSRRITRDGKSLQVEIYSNGDSGWILEVVDQHGNSTVWDDPFSSVQMAMDEVLRDIDENGVDSLIGPPSETPKQKGFDIPLSVSELEELDDFLAEHCDEELSMDVSMLQGFLTSVAIGPRLVMPSEWMPWIWDKDEGEAAAGFTREFNFEVQF